MSNNNKSIKNKLIKFIKCLSLVNNTNSFVLENFTFSIINIEQVLVTIYDEWFLNARKTYFSIQIDFITVGGNTLAVKQKLIYTFMMQQS